MGEQRIDRESEAEGLRLFKRKVLADLTALEELLAAGRIESGITRIGAEQETCLVDSAYRPAYQNLELLGDLADEHYTTELGRFNVEYNLDPLEVGPDCLDRLERQTEELLGRMRQAAGKRGLEVALTGILPTLDVSDLDLDAMTPLPRYAALNEAFNRLRGGEYHLRIKGLDELLIRHDNVMLEACTTSFQVHLQVDPDEFALRYNTAQAVAGPVLAACANSPLLFGRRLWRETRIALFQQSIDTRPTTRHRRQQLARVSFGQRWLEESVLEIFREDVAAFPAVISAPVEEDSSAVVAAGGVPELKALRLFNGTVYRWMRPCYGVAGGKAHLRIENRILPAGPSVVDEIANAALWIGLMRALPEEYGDLSRRMEFTVAHENFVSAARLGVSAQFDWPGRPNVPARQLITEVLLPLARSGLAAYGVDAGSVERYLGIVQERVASLKTASLWQLSSLASFHDESSLARRLAALTSAMITRQKSGKPVHEWELAALEEAGRRARYYSRVEQFMVTDLFTVHEDEVIDLVAAMMDWKHIRHVPVEDHEHRLVGLVTHRTLLRLLARGEDRSRGIPVKEIMHKEVVTCRPETSTLEAIATMRRHRVACLPVVEDDRLVGIVTERDLIELAAHLLEDELSK